MSLMICKTRHQTKEVKSVDNRCMYSNMICWMLTGISGSGVVYTLMGLYLCASITVWLPQAGVQSKCVKKIRIKIISPCR